MNMYPGSMITVRGMTMIGFAAKTIIEEMPGKDQ